MKIKELKKILEKAPDDERNVFIPFCSPKKSGEKINIGHNFDDNNDLDLYMIYD